VRNILEKLISTKYLHAGSFGIEDDYVYKKDIEAIARELLEEGK